MAKPVARRGQGRARVLDAALKLFSEHGVSGTSLQMIAEELGVTKAAVYYQFQAKEDIVHAVVAPALQQVGALIAAAGEQPTRADQLDATITGLVDIVVDQRRTAALAIRDPAVVAILNSDERRGGYEPIWSLLAGPDPDSTTRVSAAILGWLVLAGTDPHLDDIDDETIRAELLAAARAVIRLTASP